MTKLEELTAQREAILDPSSLGFAPIRRPLAQRPHAPRPPDRDHEHPVNRFTRAWTRAIRPLQHTPLGALMQRTLRRSCRLSNIEVQLGRGGGDLHGFRVAFLSDLHVGFFFSEAEFAELARRVSAWSPDVICLAGDLVNQERHEFESLTSGLAALQAREAVVAVPGNHDYFADPDLTAFRSVMEDAGVIQLCNRGMRVRRGASSLWLAGVDDLTAGKPDLEAALAGLHNDEPALLLSHHPDLFREAAYAGVDLTLSGHTHGGQITWFGRSLLRGTHHTRFRYWHGKFYQDGAQLLVGRGVGVCVLPIRIAAAPEVLLIELQTPAR